MIFSYQGMYKEAQKGVKDPIQQKLRDNKKQWSKDTSVLIAQLIAFKRGLNGRGDPKAGLPSSNIKDPIPGEINTYLQQMMQRFQDITQRADQIIHQQEEYSKTRRKGRVDIGGEVSPTVAALSTDIEKLARTVDKSNTATRLWSRIVRYPWFNKSEIDKARLGLMYAAADFEGQINDVEYALTSFEENAATRSFYDFSRFLLLFERRWMDAFNSALITQLEFYTENKNEIGEPPNPPENKEKTEKEHQVEEDNKKEDKDSSKNRDVAKEKGETQKIAPGSPGSEKATIYRLEVSYSFNTVEMKETFDNLIQSAVGGPCYAAEIGPSVRTMAFEFLNKDNATKAQRNLRKLNVPDLSTSIYEDEKEIVDIESVILHVPDKAMGETLKTEESVSLYQRIIDDTHKILNDIDSVLLLKTNLEIWNNKHEENSININIVGEGINEMKKLGMSVLKRANKKLPENLQEDFNKLVSDHQYYVSGFSKSLGSDATTITQLVEWLQQKTAAKLELLMKAASKNKMQRWMQRIRLSIYFSEYERSRLQAAKILRDIGDDLDMIQHMLEYRDSLLVDIIAYVQRVYLSLQEACSYFSYIARYHNYVYGVQVAQGKKRTLGQINSDQIRFLDKFADKLAQESQKLEKVTIPEGEGSGQGNTEQ